MVYVNFGRGRLDQCSRSDESNQMQSCILNLLVDNSDRCQPPELASDFISSPPVVFLLWNWFVQLISIICAHWSIVCLWLLVWYFVLYFPFSTNVLLLFLGEMGQTGLCLTLLLLSRTVDKLTCWHFSWYGFNPLLTGVLVFPWYTHACTTFLCLILASPRWRVALCLWATGGT